MQQRYTLFIENCHEHAGRSTKALTGHWPASLGEAAARSYQLSLEQIEAN